MPITDPVQRERVESCLRELEEKLGKDPLDFDAVRALPSGLFTEASKERLVAVADFYNRLNSMEGVRWVCLAVNGSAAHGYAKPDHDVDIFPIYEDAYHKALWRGLYYRQPTTLHISFWATEKSSIKSIIKETDF